MNTKKIFVSLITASLLFTACGGGGGGGSTTGDPDKNKNKITTKPVSQLTENSFEVISEHSKSVAIPLDQSILDPNTGESLYKFDVLEFTGGTASFDRDNFGFLKYTNDGSSQSGTVKIQVSRDGLKSDPLTLTFAVADQGGATPAEILKTGQLNGDFGKDRVFTKDVTTTEDNVVDPFGLRWLDNTNQGATKDLSNYTDAVKSCEAAGAGFRLPTEDELYNIIDYSKEYKKNMVDSTFALDIISSWATKVDGKKILVSNTTGTRTSLVDTAQFRCVKGSSTQNVKHLMLTDRVTGDTYDLSTKLQWSPASRSTSAEAEGYCQAKSGVYGRKQSGWRLPTVNELRSIIDNGAVTPAVHKGNYTLISSTTTTVDGAVYNYGLNLNWFDNKKPKIALIAGSDEPGVSCVREFTTALQ